MVLNPCDLIQHALRSRLGRRVVRHKDQENLRAHADSDSISQTSEELSEEIHAQSLAHDFAEREEGFPDSASQPDTENKIEAQKSVSYSYTDCVSLCNSLSRGNPVSKSVCEK
jgi:hypothetical protein